jgi:predicted ATPase
MIERCRLVNFRKHADISVPLSRFALLVGDNGAGKTSVLQAVHLAGQTFWPCSEVRPRARR